MKKYLSILSGIILFPIIFSSCLESYLDKSPESDLTTEDVYKKIDNFKKFFLTVYEGKRYDGEWKYYSIKSASPFYWGLTADKYSWEGITDCADHGRLGGAQTFKSGKVTPMLNGFMYVGYRPILGPMFHSIRICNLTLENIHLLEADQVVIDDYIAQAHFVRAFAHFVLVRLWGGMPYLTKSLGAEDVDQWDSPRLSRHETLIRIAADMDTAAIYFAKAGKMRRDNPTPGGAGHLTDPEQDRPNGVAAKAYKARALLYAASPLNNELGVKDWEDAAKASWEAIEIAKQNGYELLSAARYKENYVGVKYTNEQLWGWSQGTLNYNNGYLQGRINGMFGGSKTGFSGECPTQNFVDKFETKYGEALNTQAERDLAAAAGHYNEQDPYKDRDPRFYIDIIFNQAPNIIGWTDAKAQIYYTMVNGTAVYAELLDQSYLGVTKTGYYTRKIWGEQSVKNKFSARYSDPMIRLGELYLNYGEAANEAYGPNGSSPGASLTAVQAINVIRARIGQPVVLTQYTASKDNFRTRIKNERNVELSFEGHYYHDIRRWKDAPVAYAGPLIGVEIEKVGVSSTYPTGFKYTRKLLSADRQSSWKEAMYYLPFNTEDMYKMTKFTPNEVW